ncbi:MAG: DUF4251 domain-containing protein [Bacteroidales bacterium]|nr:DUF4251 domain-containing protein [Bacteroidales bacterium]
MKKIVLILLCLPFFISAYSQTENPVEVDQSTLSKKEQRKAEALEKEQKIKELTKKMMDSQRFVLKAELIEDKEGQRRPVDPSMNFIMVDSSVCTIQIGKSFEIGQNNVGGITKEGEITKYSQKIKSGKKGDTYIITMYVMSTSSSFDVTLFVRDSGRADATVQGSSAIGTLRYVGSVIPINSANIYKGIPTP